MDQTSCSAYVRPFIILHPVRSPLLEHLQTHGGSSVWYSSSAAMLAQQRCLAPSATGGVLQMPLHAPPRCLGLPRHSRPAIVQHRQPQAPSWGRLSNTPVCSAPAEQLAPQTNPSQVRLQAHGGLHAAVRKLLARRVARPLVAVGCATRTAVKLRLCCPLKSSLRRAVSRLACNCAYVSS